MAFDDILGIPISFEDKDEEKKSTVVEKKKDVWDTERYWSLDLEDLWKSDDGPAPEWKVEDGPTKGPKPDPEPDVATDENDVDEEADLDFSEFADDIDDMDDMDDMDGDADDDADDTGEENEDVISDPDRGPHGDPPRGRPIMDILGVRVGVGQNPLL